MSTNRSREKPFSIGKANIGDDPDPSIGQTTTDKTRSKKNQMKKPDNVDRLLIIDHTNKIISQKRDLNPPIFNGRFRDKVREKYPDYELK